MESPNNNHQRPPDPFYENKSIIQRDNFENPNENYNKDTNAINQGMISIDHLVLSSLSKNGNFTKKEEDDTLQTRAFQQEVRQLVEKYEKVQTGSQFYQLEEIRKQMEQSISYQYRLMEKVAMGESTSSEATTTVYNYETGNYEYKPTSLLHVIQRYILCNDSHDIGNDRIKKEEEGNDDIHNNHDNHPNNDKNPKIHYDKNNPNHVVVTNQMIMTENDGQTSFLQVCAKIMEEYSQSDEERIQNAYIMAHVLFHHYNHHPRTDKDSNDDANSNNKVQQHQKNNNTVSLFVSNFPDPIVRFRPATKKDLYHYILSFVEYNKYKHIVVGHTNKKGRLGDIYFQVVVKPQIAKCAKQKSKKNRKQCLEDFAQAFSQKSNWFLEHLIKMEITNNNNNHNNNNNSINNTNGKGPNQDQHPNMNPPRHRIYYAPACKERIENNLNQAVQRYKKDDEKKLDKNLMPLELRDNEKDLLRRLNHALSVALNDTDTNNSNTKLSPVDIVDGQYKIFMEMANQQDNNHRTSQKYGCGEIGMEEMKMAGDEKQEQIQQQSKLQLQLLLEAQKSKATKSELYLNSHTNPVIQNNLQPYVVGSLPINTNVVLKTDKNNLRRHYFTNTLEIENNLKKFLDRVKKLDLQQSGFTTKVVTDNNNMKYWRFIVGNIAIDRKVLLDGGGEVEMIKRSLEQIMLGNDELDIVTKLPDSKKKDNETKLFLSRPPPRKKPKTAGHHDAQYSLQGLNNGTTPKGKVDARRALSLASMAPIGSKSMDGKLKSDENGWEKGIGNAQYQPRRVESYVTANDLDTFVSAIKSMR